MPAQRSRELRPGTIAQYAAVVDAWVVPHLGGVRVSALTPAQVTKMVETLRTEKSSTGRKGALVGDGGRRESKFVIDPQALGPICQLEKVTAQNYEEKMEAIVNRRESSAA